MVNENSKFYKFIIISQCFGQLAHLSFDNGFMFNYLGSLIQSDSTLVILLKTPNIASMLLVLPLAFLADKYGKKIVGQSGNIIQILGLTILALAPLTSAPLLMLFSGVIVFSIGSALFRCSWFALLQPIVSESDRAHFFARMRTAWKVCGILFTLLVQFLLGVDNKIIFIQLIIFLIICCFLQVFFYQKIPELEKPNKENKERKFVKEIKFLFQDKNFLRFTLFKFSFPLMVGAIALLFNIFEKRYLSFTPSDIMMMGNLLFIGGVCGFWVGAHLMKKFESRQVFLFSTLAITAVALIFPLSIQFKGLTVLILCGTSTFILGCSLTALGIAETSLMLSLLQPERKSLASSLCIMCTQFGTASAGILVALIIKNFEFGEADSHWNIHSLYLALTVIPLPIVTYLLTKCFGKRY